MCSLLRRIKFALTPKAERRYVVQLFEDVNGLVPSGTVTNTGRWVGRMTCVSKEHAEYVAFQWHHGLGFGTRVVRIK